MRFFAIILLFLFAVAGSAFLAKVELKESIEEELLAKAISVLKEKGFDGVRVEFDHLNGILSGSVERPEEIPLVVALLREEVPAGYWPDATEAALAIRPTLTPHLFVSRGEGSNTVRVDGKLAESDDSARVLLGSRLRALTDVGSVDNQIALDVMVQSFPQMAEFASLVSGLLTHPGAVEVVLKEGELQLRGEVPNDGIKGRLLELASRVGARTVKDEIVVKPLATFTRMAEVKLTRNRFGITVSGWYPTKEERDALLERIRSAGGGATVLNRVEVSEHCGPQEWQEPLLELLPVLLGEIKGEMTAEFAQSHIRLTGRVESEQAKDALLDRLAVLQASPSKYELLTDFEISGGGPSEVQLDAVLEEDLLILKGKVVQAEFVKSLEEKIKETLPNLSIKDELVVVPGRSRDAWTSGMIDFLAEALTRVSSAHFILKDGVFDLEGRTVTLPDRQVIQNLAVNTVPADFKIQNRLLHADQPFPKPTLLPETRTRLAEALKSLPIYFEVNSDTPRADDQGKLDSIFTAITEAGSEIALVATGFADNVGNAERNHELALQRAATVRSELIKLGVSEDLIEMESKEEDVSNIARSERWKSRRVEVSLKEIPPSTSPQ